MARIKGNLFNLSGKMGDFVFREVNGKVVVARAPGKRKKSAGQPPDPKQVQFTVAQKLAAAVKRISQSALLWEHYCRSSGRNAKSIRGAMFNSFYNEITLDDISKVQISPVNEFDFSLNDPVEVVNGGEGFVLSIAPLGSGTGIWPPRERYVSLNGVLMLVHECERLKEKYECIPLSSSEQLTVLDAGLQFTLQLNEKQMVSYQQSKSAALIFALVTADINKNAVKGSASKLMQVR